MRCGSGLVGAWQRVLGGLSSAEARTGVFAQRMMPIRKSIFLHIPVVGTFAVGEDADRDWEPSGLASLSLRRGRVPGVGAVS